MAAVPAGGAVSRRARALAPAVALACLLLPGSAAAQGLSGVTATAQGTATKVSAAATSAVPKAPPSVPLPASPPTPQPPQGGAGQRVSKVLSTPQPAPVEKTAAPVVRVAAGGTPAAPVGTAGGGTPATVADEAGAAIRSAEDAADPVTRTAAGGAELTRRVSDGTTRTLADLAWATIPWVDGLLDSGFGLERELRGLPTALGVVAPAVPGRAPAPPSPGTPDLRQILHRTARGGGVPAGRSATPAAPGRPLAASNVRGVAIGGSEPPPPRPGPFAPELPSVPSGLGGAASSALSFTGFAALFGAAALLLAGGARRLRIAPVLPRPAPFVSLLERPG